MIEKIENYKVELMADVIIACRLGQFPENQMATGEELAKIEALDKVFLENGIEETDIVIAFAKHNIIETEKFRAIT